MSNPKHEQQNIPGTIIDDAKVYPIAKAKEAAELLEKYDLDGWIYEVESVDEDNARIACYDERHDFVGYM